MSIFGAIAGGGIVDAVGSAFDKLFTSDEEKAQAAAVMEKIRQQPHLLQAEINKVEAGHRSVFVAGWRPFIGWVCGAAIGWTYLGAPMVGFLSSLTGEAITPPVVDTSMLFELVLSMLGLGSLRTFEKIKGVTK